MGISVLCLWLIATSFGTELFRRKELDQNVEKITNGFVNQEKQSPLNRANTNKKLIKEKSPNSALELIEEADEVDESEIGSIYNSCASESEYASCIEEEHEKNVCDKLLSQTEEKARTKPDSSPTQLGKKEDKNPERDYNWKLRELALREGYHTHFVATDEDLFAWFQAEYESSILEQFRETINTEPCRNSVIFEALAEAVMGVQWVGIYLLENAILGNHLWMQSINPLETFLMNVLPWKKRYEFIGYVMENQKDEFAAKFNSGQIQEAVKNDSNRSYWSVFQYIKAVERVKSHLKNEAEYEAIENLKAHYKSKYSQGHGLEQYSGIQFYDENQKCLGSDFEDEDLTEACDLKTGTCTKIKNPMLTHENLCELGMHTKTLESEAGSFAPTAHYEPSFCSAFSTTAPTIGTSCMTDNTHYQTRKYDQRLLKQIPHAEEARRFAEEFKRWEKGIMTEWGRRWNVIYDGQKFVFLPDKRTPLTVFRHHPLYRKNKK